VKYCAKLGQVRVVRKQHLGETTARHYAVVMGIEAERDIVTGEAALQQLFLARSRRGR
jgi:hypothetical protein